MQQSEKSVDVFVAFVPAPQSFQLNDVGRSSLAIEERDVRATLAAEHFNGSTASSRGARPFSNLFERCFDQQAPVLSQCVAQCLRDMCDHEAFRTRIGNGDALRETEEPVRSEPTGSKPVGEVPIAQTKQGGTPGETPLAARDKTETVETVRKQPATKAVPLIIAAMRAHDDDLVPLSVIGSHVRAANPEFDPRTYGCAKLVDLLEKTGQFEVKRNEVPVRARR